MTLTSLAMLSWIAVTVTACWVAPRPAQPYLMGLLSACFLAWHAPLALGLLLLMAAMSFGAVRRQGRWPLAPAVAGFTILAILLGFNAARMPGRDALETVVAPLGLAYFALRALHYCIEGWKGTLPAHTFRDYLNYLIFLPTLMTGPIHRLQEFQHGLRRRRWDPVLFSLGCERVLYGYVKIVFLANYLVSAKLVGVIAALPKTSPLGAWLDCLRYGLNLYWQFSGYSDVAIGFALLLGIRISENFNFPFLARNINDFWNRWHVSLTSWCRDYLYLPVLAVGRRPWVAVLASMLALGLWHELSIRYVLWGLYHGTGIALWQGFQRLKGNRSFPQGSPASRLMAPLAILVTLNFVILSFAITKEATLQGTLRVYATLLGAGRP